MNGKAELTLDELNDLLLAVRILSGLVPDGTSTAPRQATELAEGILLTAIEEAQRKEERYVTPKN